MELRQLTTDLDCALFCQMMRIADAEWGGSLIDTKASKVSKIQVQFARQFALFDETSPRFREPVGGFSLHALNEYAQMFPTPDVSSYSPKEVFEGSQLWSRDAESAVLLRKGILIILTLLQARAFLIYPMVVPHDTSRLYRSFQRAGDPFKLQFAKTLQGETVWLQPMILAGEMLAKEKDHVVHSGFACCAGATLNIKFRGSTDSYGTDGPTLNISNDLTIH